MTSAAVENKELFAKLTEESLRDFCEGVTMMFGNEFSSTFLGSETMTVEQLKAEYEGKLVSVNLIDCVGPMDQGYLFLYDKTSTFLLGGVFNMQPPQGIKENLIKGQEEDALAMIDAISEVGNLLVGSIDKIYREGGNGVEGFGEEQRAILHLPISVGCINIDIADKTEGYEVLSFEFKIDDWDPIILRALRF